MRMKSVPWDPRSEDPFLSEKSANRFSVLDLLRHQETP